MGQKLNKEKEKEEDNEEEENEENSSNDNETNIDELEADNVNDKDKENEENETSDPNKKKKKKKKKTKNKEEQPVKMDKIEQLLCDTFQNTDIDFNYKEILTIKLRVHDAEKYFIRKINSLLNFNIYIFQQSVNNVFYKYSFIN